MNAEDIPTGDDGEPTGYSYEELRESELRRGEFSPAALACFRNGQFWGLPRITPEILGQWPAIRSYLESLAEFDRSLWRDNYPDGVDFGLRDGAIRGIAACLLEANYVLLTRQAEALIPDDEDGMRELLFTVRGILLESRAVLMTYAERVSASIVMPN